MGNFYPPVIFEVKAIAGEAMATFSGINKQLKTMEAQAIKTGRALTTMNKAAIIGVKVLKGLGVAFAAFTAIGIKEVIDLEKSMTRLGKAMANVGVSTEENRIEVAHLVESYEQLGFGAERAADAYSVLITATGDVDKSNKLLATSADLARARNIGLEESAKLLVRAQRGNAKIFTQFGIELDKTVPKAQAIEKAMGDLTARLSGQAIAYTKTFAGQLEVLQENLKNIAEAIGGRVLPILNRFLGALNGTGAWIKKNNDLAIALAATVTVLLIPAIVSLTKKLALLTLTMLRSPLVRIAVLIGAISYQFVKAYNSSEQFRANFAKVANAVLAIVGTLINGFENFVQMLMFGEKAVIKFGIAWAKFRGNEKKQAEFEKDLANWEKSYAAIDKWSDGVENAKRSVEKFAQKPLKLDLKSLMPSIPGFDNQDFTGLTKGLDASVKKAITNAKQRFRDFAKDIRDQFREIGQSFDAITGKDFQSVIKLRLSDPVTQMTAALNSSLSAYEKAMGSYAQANKALAKAQQDYVKAIASGNEALIAAAESALRYAEQGVSKVMDRVSSAVSDVESAQEDIMNSIVDAQKQIAELEAERARILEEAQKERLALEKDYNKQVAKLRKDYDASVLAAEAEAAKRRAEIIKTSIDQMRSAFQSATYRTLGDVYQGLTFEGRYLKGGSMEKILKTLGMQTNKAKNLANNAAQLAGLGFSQTFIEEVLSLGPDMGNKLSETILNATPESIEQLKTYWEELQKTSSHGVDDIAKKLNSGMTLATEELTQQLADVQTELDATLKELNTDLQESLLEAFTSYSEAVDEINQRTTAAIAAIDAQIKALIETIAKLLALLDELARRAGGTKTTTGSTFSSTHMGLTETQWTDWRKGERDTGTTNVTINATTTATAQDIANEVGWAIRTSGDVNYGGL